MFKRKNKELIEFAEWVADMMEQLPSGIDLGAYMEDTHPEDAFAHIGGLVWKRCKEIMGAGETG